MLLAPACSTNPPLEIEAPAAELVSVPFFPQSRYQCGPAALATVLVDSGVSVTPQALVQEVYLPDRRGSLQIEMMGSARRHGRLPVPLPPELEALFDEVAGGSPVLVLQNLGLAWLPRWHYAVVVGFDPASGHVLLRSGRESRRQVSVVRFERSWSLADRWAVRVLKPGEVPVTAEPDTYLRAVMDSRQSLTTEEQREALTAGAAHWPGSADLAFAAANFALEQRDWQTAAHYYERALDANPDHLGALNNLADLMLSLGEVERARTLIDRAMEILPPLSPLRPAIESTLDEVRRQHL